jgi:hypothetical protein
MAEHGFALSWLVDAVLDRIEEGDGGQVEEITAAVLNDNNWNTLLPDTLLNGETEERIFEALVSSNKIISILIPSSDVAEVSHVKDLLQKAIPAMHSLKSTCIVGTLTETEAEEILSALLMSPTLNEMRVRLAYCTDGIVKPLVKYLREASTLKTLELNWETNLQDTDLSPVSQDGFASICVGIGENASLSLLHLVEAPADEEDANMAARSVALAMANSKSLDGAGSRLEKRAFLDKVRTFLALVPAVQNFDLCVREGQGGTAVALALGRGNPWKPLLSKNIPLALWPRILAKANAWNRHFSNHYVSHGPLDALFFLMREKNDVLLQNVRRRKIRKRKRGQFYY